MNARIPKADGLVQTAARFLTTCGPVPGDAEACRAWWIILNAAWRLAASCAEVDGDLAAVEREGERLYQMLAKLGGTEEHIVDGLREKQGGPV